MILHDSLTSDSKRIKVVNINCTNIRHSFAQRAGKGSCKGAQEENVNKPLIFHLVAKNVNQLILFQLVAVVGWAGPGLVVLPYAIFRKAPKSFSTKLYFKFCQI